MPARSRSWGSLPKGGGPFFVAGQSHGSLLNLNRYRQSLARALEVLAGGRYSGHPQSPRAPRFLVSFWLHFLAFETLLFLIGPTTPVKITKVL
jgi:hypothetical protein